MAWVRVVDTEQGDGRTLSVLEETAAANPDSFTVLDEPAVGPDGAPLPVEYPKPRVTVAQAAASKKTGHRAAPDKEKD